MNTSTTAVKPLRTLVAVRKRQQERLEDALKSQRQVLAERQAEAGGAQAEKEACQEAERHNLAERDVLLSCGFTPDKLIGLEHQQQTLANATMQGDARLKKCEEAVAQQTQAVLAVQRDIRRNAQRTDGFKAQINLLISARDQALEDSAEEEAEETSTARFCGRQRAAKESRRGA
jgi:Bacterial type III secretion protein (HrpB7)